MPRGPDVVHRIRVKRSWLLDGETIQLTLPRNLTCAECAGGGCDRCERAGAISLRARGEAAPLLTVPLPKRAAADLDREPTLILRVPDQGGLPRPGLDLPRGLLLLRIEAAEHADAGVERARRSLPRFSLRPKPQTPAPDAPAGAAQSRSARWFAPLVIGVVFALLAFLWVWRARHGH